MRGGCGGCSRFPPSAALDGRIIIKSGETRFMGLGDVYMQRVDSYLENTKSFTEGSLQAWVEGACVCVCVSERESENTLETECRAGVGIHTYHRPFGLEIILLERSSSHSSVMVVVLHRAGLSS